MLLLHFDSFSIILMLFFKNLFNSFLPAIFWWLFVLVLICTPGKDLPRLGSWTEIISLDKIIHVLVFGAMALFFMMPFAQRISSAQAKKNLFLKLAIATALWGLTTEFIQRFWIPGRSFDLYDVVADSIGAFTAYFYAKKYLLE